MIISDQSTEEKWMVVGRDTGTLIAIDKNSGGYPYMVSSIENVRYFSSKEEAEKYASHWPDLVVARCELMLYWEVDYEE